MEATLAYAQPKSGGATGDLANDPFALTIGTSESSDSVVHVVGKQQSVRFEREKNTFVYSNSPVFKGPNVAYSELSKLMRAGSHNRSDDVWKDLWSGFCPSQGHTPVGDRPINQPY